MLGESGVGSTTLIRNYNSWYNFGSGYFQIWIWIQAILNYFFYIAMKNGIQSRNERSLNDGFNAILDFS